MSEESTQEGRPSEEGIGGYLKGLRTRLGFSLREVHRRSGVSNPYLSQIERGVRRPGPEILKKLARAYGISARELMQRAGYVEEMAGEQLERLEIERAYRFVVEDPRFRVGTRPARELDIEAKRFIIEMYEALTGKRLL